ncbi:MAG: MATE family efflux transporter [Clostridiales bacterium]|nr:MATE family efflux transporter [Clostridiales bacterium]
MARKSRNYEIDMCNGPLTRKIITYCIPLALSGILQLLYNAADIIVVGRFTGPTALAAVGSTGSLINLIVNLLIGLSVGASVCVANFYGAGREKDVRETVHTAMLISVIGGVIVAVVGMVFAKTFLGWMGSPDDVIDQATLYLRIYFAGMPLTMAYNFASAIFRALGDTKRPLYYLAVSGLVNVILNLIFVIVFKMGVAGVATATVVAQAVSTTLIIMCMIRSHSVIHLQRDMLRIHGDKLKEIVRVGLPAGLQGTIFSISNVLIQSSINSFGSIAIAGNSASSNLEGFMYTSMNSVYQAALSFAGQNMGARKYSRLKKVLCNCLAIVTGIGIGMGAIMYLFRYQLLGIYSSDMDVINFGIERLELFCLTYFTCGAMDVMVGQMRGMGYSIVPMIVSLVGVCGIRIVWIFTVFKASNSLLTLYMSYPVSWVVTLAVHFSTFLYVYHKVKQRTDGVPDVPTVKA